jgi:hypothetical protein
MVIPRFIRELRPRQISIIGFLYMRCSSGIQKLVLVTAAGQESHSEHFTKIGTAVLI